jgi:hypothetical protein
MDEFERSSVCERCGERIGMGAVESKPRDLGSDRGYRAAYIVRTWGAAVLRPYTIAGDSRNIAAIAGN